MIRSTKTLALRQPAYRSLAALMAAATAVLLLLAVPAWAGGGRDHHMGAGEMGEPGGLPGMHPRMFERMADELALTDAQRKQIRGLFDAARPAMEQRREKMRADAELLRRTEPGDKDYAAVVERVSRSAGDLAASGVADAAKLRAQVWALLTPEQRTKMKDMGDKMRDRMAERRQMREKMREDRRKGAAPAP